MRETQETERPLILKYQAVKKSIVAIDDSAEILQLVTTLFEMDGYEIFTAQSGIEAFKVLSEVDTPNLILLDMQMDDMSGAEFLILLEKKLPDVFKSVPVVFLTGMDDIPDSTAVGFIRKPIQDITQFLKDAHNFIEAGARHSS